jgi:hypothetical protein
MTRWTRPLALTECHNFLKKKHPVLVTYSIQNTKFTAINRVCSVGRFQLASWTWSKNTQKVTYEECNYSVRLNTTPLLQTTEEHYTALWNIAPCGLVEVDRRFRGAYCIRRHMMMEVVRKSEMLMYIDENARRYIPEGCVSSQCSPPWGPEGSLTRQ